MNKFVIEWTTWRHSSIYCGCLSIDSLTSLGHQRYLGFACDFSHRAHVPFFQISYSSFTIILVSASSSCFTLAVTMREVSCVAYTPVHEISVPYSPCWMVPLCFGLLTSRIDLNLYLKHRTNNDNNNHYHRYISWQINCLICQHQRLGTPLPPAL